MNKLDKLQSSQKSLKSEKSNCALQCDRYCFIIEIINKILTHLVHTKRQGMEFECVCNLEGRINTKKSATALTVISLHKIQQKVTTGPLSDIKQLNANFSETLSHTVIYIALFT